MSRDSAAEGLIPSSTEDESEVGIPDWPVFTEATPTSEVPPTPDAVTSLPALPTLEGTSADHTPPHLIVSYSADAPPSSEGLAPAEAPPPPEGLPLPEAPPPPEGLPLPEAPPPPYEEPAQNWRLLHIDFRPQCRNSGGILVKPKFDSFE